ncbi:hypothetical protein A6F53_00160 [Levilactobacillus brevis]|uniref:hypothetical protein n=1 Tax=Levilactobacillus brevis TaxID=1580 RepID=UPI00041D7150|nr:hypothetical protein [Levilactobacillus brevis]ANN47756.1 hypothetical protein A6F53_00160 [Levilactobacillus brevis]ATU70643.1 hypothetical protein CT113_10035 [Levilactobacillus brevis]
MTSKQQALATLTRLDDHTRQLESWLLEQATLSVDRETLEKMLNEVLQTNQAMAKLEDWVGGKQ